MLKNITLFSVKLVIFSVLIFFIHIELLKKMGYLPYENLIIEAYFANTVLAIFIFSALTFLQQKYSDQLGFLFMAGSLIKFAVFFVFFSPQFREDGEISRLEFLSYFVPYLLALFLETLAVAKILNLPKNED